MADKTILLTHAFDGKFEEIYEHILDFTKFGKFHPYMKNVTELSKIEPNCIKYQVNEEVVLFGFLKIKPNYEAEIIELEPQKHIRYYSFIKNAVRLNINFIFPENHAESPINVIERIELKGNGLLIAYFASILTKAHFQTFENLRKNLKTSE
ncbi:hypothetical protein EMA8858_00040 [Emticicia aquatica]|jgi:hypothetical protein|uniref:SRPBCC family protein n=1 Tax=Emticicia aquatica TaxID=1681835 RepID=A0ABM9AJP8_9BACT|nr:hypothetical protein [Emticicia aquatica]CAH0993935.1 hypothetical protein EMA8858_00040 [Emticicia aquatica]